MVEIKRGEVWLIALDPTVGSEIEKTRPCAIISPNVCNRKLKTVIVAPLTKTIKDYPTRLTIEFQDRQGSIALDQIRSVDKARLVKKVGSIRQHYKAIAEILSQMFEV